MPGAVHESIVALLCDHPEWIDVLLPHTGHGSLPAGLRRIDSTQRLVDPVELRPDLLLAEGEKGPWVAIEIQLAKDLQKEIRWPLLAALLQSTRGQMGDILVVTAHGHVAEWAQNLPMAEGPPGANLKLVPVVLHLGDEEARILLDPARPELAFFAAWAVQDQQESGRRRGAGAPACYPRRYRTKRSWTTLLLEFSGSRDSSIHALMRVKPFGIEVWKTNRKFPQ